MYALTGTVADFIHNILEGYKSQGIDMSKGQGTLDKEKMCKEAETMANEIHNTILIPDSTLPEDAETQAAQVYSI